MHSKGEATSATVIGSTITEIQDRQTVIGSLTHRYGAIRVLVNKNLGIEWNTIILV